MGSVAQINKKRKIVILPLDLDSVHITGYADASVANNLDLSLLNGNNNGAESNGAATVVYGSWKFRSVTRSVLGAEVYAFSHCMDYVPAITQDLKSMLGRKIRSIIFTDSKNIFDIITKLRTIAEKIIIIDVASLRKNYSTAEFTIVDDVLSMYNIANRFTKTGLICLRSMP